MGLAALRRSESWRFIVQTWKITTLFGLSALSLTSLFYISAFSDRAFVESPALMDRFFLHYNLVVYAVFIMPYSLIHGTPAHVSSFDIQLGLLFMHPVTLWLVATAILRRVPLGEFNPKSVLVVAQKAAAPMGRFALWLLQGLLLVILGQIVITSPPMVRLTEALWGKP